MNTLIYIIFSLSYFLILVSEGLGLQNGRLFSYFLVLITPSLLVLSDFLCKRRIYFPKQMSMLFLIFGTWMFATLVFSVNMQNSFEYFLLFISQTLFFIYGYNHKSEITRVLFKFIIGTSLLFTLYSLFVDFFLIKKWLLLVPQSAVNLIYQTYPSHNQLGDFIGLVLIILVYYLLQNKFIISSIIGLSSFLIPFILAYSRSAYLSYIISTGTMIIVFIKDKSIKLNKILLIILPIIFIMIISFFVILPDKAKYIPIIGNARSFLVDNFGLRGKSSISDHLAYIQQALDAIKSNPFFGYGQSNFKYISVKASNGMNWTASSHNIFLDSIVGTGLIGGFIYLLIIIKLFKNSKKTIIFFLILYLFLNFQTNYIFNFYSISTLFFILGGLAYKEKSNYSSFAIPFTLTTITLVISGLILTSLILVRQKDYQIAFYAYPFNDQNVYPLLDNLSNHGKAHILMRYLYWYSQIYRADAHMQNSIGDYYQIYGKDNNALEAYKDSYNWNKFEGDVIFNKIYFLELRLYGKKQARIFADSFFSSIKNIQIYAFSNHLRQNIQSFCLEVYERNDCNYSLLSK